jgi:WD40 repeat protein
LSPDGKTLVSGGEDNTVRVWNLETGKCNWIREEHTNWVRSVAFSFDGTMVASGSEDETIKIWDAKTGNCLKTLRVFKPYEGLNIKGVQGLTEADIDSLKVLGAIQNSV